MELEKQLLRQNCLKSKAFTQIALDDDCIVRDNKPDVIKIIHTKGSVSFEETKVTNQTVWVTGKLKFTVLYRSDDKAGKLESLQETVDFSEKLIMDAVDELDTVKLGWQLEDLSVTAINSRKLSVRALVEIRASAQCQEEEELVSAVLGEPDVEQRTEEKEMLLLTDAKRDILRTHNEMNLPGANPNISRVIYQNVDIRGKEISLNKDRLQLSGEAHVTLLYAGEDGQLVWFGTMVPFSGVMDCGELDGQSLYWIRTTPLEIELEAVNDYDGEMRALALDMVFDVDMKIWKEEKVPVLTDAYAMSRNLVPERQWTKVSNLLMKNMAKLRVSEQLSLESGKEKILQLQNYEGSLQIDGVEPVENGLSVEGVLLLHILYATADDSSPVEHGFSQVPFRQVIDIQGLQAGDKNVTYEMESGIDQLQVNLLDSDRYEVKATIAMSVLALKEERFEKIVDIRTEPLDEDALQKQPGLTGYIAQGDEDLWDVAKNYHPTEQDIITTNGLKTSKLRMGDKILIVKKVG